MRRLFACVAALGLLGGIVGCNCHCIHGRCDCSDEGYGCVDCMNHGGDHGGHPYGGLVPPGEGPGYVSSGTMIPASTTVQK